MAALRDGPESDCCSLVVSGAGFLFCGDLTLVDVLARALFVDRNIRRRK